MAGNFRVGLSLVSSLPFLAACATVPQQPMQPYQLSQAQVGSIQYKTKLLLKDPDSAKFRNIVAGVGDDKKVVTVCGLVNAKNSFGGFVGERLFIGAIDTATGQFAVKQLAPEDIYLAMAMGTCRRIGLQVG